MTNYFITLCHPDEGRISVDEFLLRDSSLCSE
jgi:hypothetical protein